MVIGYHIIFGAYGFWLPNDPRGSWSNEVWADELKPFGQPNKFYTRRSLAHDRHDVAARYAAKKCLKYPAVRFSGVQARAVGQGFGQLAAKIKLTVHACSIMPDHVHLVVLRHRLGGAVCAAALKRAATRQLMSEGLHPFGRFARSGRIPTPWAKRGWEVYLDNPYEMRRSIRYVEENPPRAKLPRQNWPFVVAYEALRGRSG